jgi:uncharacterized protein
MHEARPRLADGLIGRAWANLEIARKFKPMEADEMDALRERCRAFAADGRYERFKTTKFYDGDLGCQQHGYPTAKKLPF